MSMLHPSKECLSRRIAWRLDEALSSDTWPIMGEPSTSSTTMFSCVLNKVLDGILQQRKRDGLERRVQHKTAITDLDWSTLKEYFSDIDTTDAVKLTYYVCQPHTPLLPEGWRNASRYEEGRPCLHCRWWQRNPETHAFLHVKKSPGRTSGKCLVICWYHQRQALNQGHQEIPIKTQSRCWPAFSESPRQRWAGQWFPLLVNEVCFVA